MDEALTRGWAVDRISALTGIDPWFVDQFLALVQRRRQVRGWEHLHAMPADVLAAAKQDGFSDDHLADVLNTTAAAVRERRTELGIRPVFKTVDTCGGEFVAHTPYHYSTYDDHDELVPATRDSVMVLGSGPNRIGQGVEFDYCCVHAVQALADAGYETIMVNCNPETVSTDYDTSDRLYFEPLTFEDVMEVVAREQPIGVVVAMGGQTPLKLARHLEAAGVPILGTSPDAIDAAEDRGRFGALMDELGVAMPEGGVARSAEEARTVAARISYPVLVRPSYVLGGRAMEIVDDRESLDAYLATALADDDLNGDGGLAILVDRFLDGAVEVDVDAVFDGTDLFVGGVLEHIEEAGVHSGDSACTLPPITLSRSLVARIGEVTRGIAEGLGVRGLVNIQFAVRDDAIWCIEANPRASRTVPFVSKATGVPLAKIAARVMAGESLKDLRDQGVLPEEDAITGPRPAHVAVKEAVLPFDRFPGVDALLGPEMRSTGEVMGIDTTFGAAFAKSQAGTGSMVLPESGTVFVSVANRDKRSIVFPVKRLVDLGFSLVATEGTADLLQRAGVEAEVVAKVSTGRTELLDMVGDGRVTLILNTPSGAHARDDGYQIRQAAIAAGVPVITTLAGIMAAIQGIEAIGTDGLQVRSLQDHLAGTDHRPAAG